MMPASSKDLPSTAVAGLAQLLDASGRPIYAVGGDRRIVYCNASLASWLGTERSQIVGRFVEYHSVPAETTESSHKPAKLLTDLCPPPVALAGKQCSGTVATVGRDGRLIHRRADFLPLVDSEADAAAGVLVLLASVDLLPHELSAEVAEEATPDELHRAIRRFRQTQSEGYAIESLLGTSSVIEKVRAQVAAAATGRASVLVRGRRGSGRAQVARAIHYHSARPTDRLLPLDCQAATEDILRRLLDSIRDTGRGDRRTTLLILNLDQLSSSIQPHLLGAIKDVSQAARVIGTIAYPRDEANGEDAAAADATGRLDPRLLDAVSTITIDVPRLTDRLADLPLLAQSFLEARNRGSEKQIGSLRPDVLDVLALYRWPGELDELRDIIAAAHAACTGQQISPADLPAVVHHAAKTAALVRRTPPERIVLDEFLASIEREVIERAHRRGRGQQDGGGGAVGNDAPTVIPKARAIGSS